MRPQAFAVHRLPRRTRLQIPALRQDAERLQSVGDALSRCPGVNAVHTNQRTGSVVVEHGDSDLDVIVLYAQESELFDLNLEGPRAPETSPAVAVERSLARLDSWVRSETVDRSTLGSITFVALLVAAAWQAARGQVLPAAATLAWYALALAPERARALLSSLPEAAAQNAEGTSARTLALAEPEKR
jgi:Heavy metal associated domain 2